jgi:hypothetical protein
MMVVMEVAIGAVIQEIMVGGYLGRCWRRRGRAKIGDDRSDNFPSKANRNIHALTSASIWRFSGLETILRKICFRRIRPRASFRFASAFREGARGFLFVPEIQYPDFAPLSLDILDIFIHFISIDRVFYPTGLRKERERESLYRCH